METTRIEANKCLRCQYVWPSRFNRIPKCCPYCKRRDWNDATIVPRKPLKSWDQMERRSKTPKRKNKYARIPA